MAAPWAECFSHALTLEPAAPPAPDALPTHGGVYAIADENDAPILVAACEDLRRVVTARLAAPPSDRKSRRTNLGEIARRVRWTPTFSQFETAWRYHAVVRRVYPDRYRKLLSFGPAWFLRADPREAFPKIAAVREFADDGAPYVGPFAARADAEDAARFLEDIFDLCRKYDVLRQAPHGQPCEYLEMARCPAPCDGRVPMSSYQYEIERAMAFAAGRRAERLDELAAAMRSAAAALAFEKANTVKALLERGRSYFERESLRFVAGLDTFRWLIVQRGGPRSRSAKRLLLRPFFASTGGIVAGEPVALVDVPTVAEDWLRQTQALRPAELTAAERSEQFWLVCHFLFKGDAAPGRFYPAARLPVAAALADELAEHFIRRASAREEPVAPTAATDVPVATHEDTQPDAPSA